MISIPAHIFREYDIRGAAESDLTDELAKLLGQAFGTYVQSRSSNNTVLVGMDNRLSSPRIKKSFVRGLTFTGCNVLDVGTVITPALYYACHLYSPGGAAMITGSHNPPGENGFKLVLGKDTIFGAEILSLKELMAAKSFLTGPGKCTRVDLKKDYLEMLGHKIRLGPRKLKVVVDCGNGATALFTKQLMKSWGCEADLIYCTPDGTFPNHHPDPVRPANLLALKKKVLSAKADLGIAYDGDGDRIGVVDDRGKIIWGDRLMILFWREILPKHPRTPVIIEVKCSQSLVDEVVKLGATPCFYKTGHSLIKARMKATGAVFTGEMSGHMFFADEYFGFDDALYATGRLLRILSNTTVPLSQLFNNTTEYYATAETRIPCSDAGKFNVAARLAGYFKTRHQVIDIDGARILFDDGWALVRPSNTQPVLVARCESQTPEGLRRITGIVGKKLLACPEVGDFNWEY